MGAVRAFPPATDLHFGLQDLRAWVVMEMTESPPIGLILLILGTAESYRDTKTKQAETKTKQAETRRSRREEGGAPESGFGEDCWNLERGSRKPWVVTVT